MSEAAPSPPPAPPTLCCLMGMRLARVTRAELLDRIFAALAAGQGGWLVTANLDFLRRYVEIKTKIDRAMNEGPG